MPKLKSSWSRHGVDRIHEMSSNVNDNPTEHAKKSHDMVEENNSSLDVDHQKSTHSTSESSDVIPRPPNSGRATYHEHAMKIRKRTLGGKVQSVVQPPEKQCDRKSLSPTRANAKSQKSSPTTSNGLCGYDASKLRSSNRNLTSTVDQYKNLENKNQGKPYACRVRGCDKAYWEERTLKRHEIIHDKERRYECHECKKPFAQNIHLVSHMRTHAGKKETGSQCDRVSPVKLSTQKEQKQFFKRERSDKNRFKCQHRGCDKNFAENYMLARATHRVIHRH